MNSLTHPNPLRIKLKLKDEIATKIFAKELAKYCNAPMVIFLQGELGAGKTTFARGFLEGLGYQGRVKSPTFTIVEPYIIQELFSEVVSVKVYHFDLYRLVDPEELYYLGMDEYFAADTICLIEWPEKALSLLPKATVEISLNTLDDEGRAVALVINDPKLAQFVSKILKNLKIEILC